MEWYFTDSSRRKNVSDWHNVNLNNRFSFGHMQPVLPIGWIEGGWLRSRIRRLYFAKVKCLHLKYAVSWLEVLLHFIPVWCKRRRNGTWQSGEKEWERVVLVGEGNEMNRKQSKTKQKMQRRKDRINKNSHRNRRTSRKKV